MSIITLILFLSFSVNFSLLFPTEHQLTTYGVNNASSTSQLTTPSTTWSTPKVQFSVNCTCSINTTNSWVTYPGSISTESFCDWKTAENCTQACMPMLNRTIFNVQSESVYLNIIDGVDLNGYLCGLMAKGVPSPYIVLTSKVECNADKSFFSSHKSYETSFSLHNDYYCGLIENSNADSTVEMNEMTTIS
ncbi:uncharacterized protein LOC112539362 isoform X2 [Tetranychus urticae]|uniref:uncharacterized protein LOC112539362 isoform X2 n=1 Tax=Tetranychus urticae TaxID=32264 RepID=UPI000D64498E|nr:uncharacterized protein LOC112539362 isoform X2 [Tetranychus urticae]